MITIIMLVSYSLFCLTKIEKYVTFITKEGNILHPEKKNY
jgi:hypothetical protein